MDGAGDWTVNLDVSQLSACRQDIDALDQQLIAILARRFAVAKEIAKLKQAHDLPIVQPDRAALVEQRYVERGREHSVADSFMIDLYQLIHQETCRLEAEVITESY